MTESIDLTTQLAEPALDYRDLTCTNLMLKLKIKTKKMNIGEEFFFHSNREQWDNIQKPFSNKKFKMRYQKLEPNNFLVGIQKLTK